MDAPLLVVLKRASRARGGQLLLRTHAALLQFLVAMESEMELKVAMTETRCLETAALLLALTRPVTLAVADRQVPKTLALNARVVTTALEEPQ